MSPAQTFKDLLGTRRTPIGHMLMEFAGRGTPRMLEVAGADFALIDMEHTALTLDRVADLLGWFRGTRVAPLIRVPQLQYHFIARVLDAGAAGVMVPDVKDGAEAAAFVAAAKYAPLGQRGVFFGGNLTGYLPVQPGAFMAEANAATTLICQIESREGLAHCDAIAATLGIDALWIGHNDLSRSLGIPGKFDAPEFTDAFQHIAKVAQRHGRALGVQPRNLAQARAFAALGANLFSYSADLFVYLEALKTGLAEFRQLGTPSIQ